MSSKRTEDDDEDDLPALFRETIPDTLPADMLALAHLSDVEDNDEQLTAGPVHRRKKKNTSGPYSTKPRKSKEQQVDDEMKELDFRVRAWKPFKTGTGSKNAD
jgi:hypothetical protein